MFGAWHIVADFVEHLHVQLHCGDVNVFGVVTLGDDATEWVDDLLLKKKPSEYHKHECYNSPTIA